MPEEVDSPAGVFEEDSDDSEWTELEEFAGAVEVDGEGEGSEEEVSGDAKPGQQDVASGNSLTVCDHCLLHAVMPAVVSHHRQEQR